MGEVEDDDIQKRVITFIGEGLMASYLIYKEEVTTKEWTLLEGERHVQKGNRGASILQQVIVFKGRDEQYGQGLPSIALGGLDV